MIDKYMKNYIVLLLMLVSVHVLLADPTTSQGTDLHLSPPTGEEASSMRAITQDEADGKVPIVIHINESLVIPIHYQRVVIKNDFNFLFGATDKTVINLSADGITWSNCGMVLDLNLICTGTQVGQTTVQCGEEGQLKSFLIQIVE
jgi:hypothetical protein